MRIAITHLQRHIIGGLETYLSVLIPALIERGHEVAFLHEVEGPPERPMIWNSNVSPVWLVATLGQEAALAGLKRWRPDIIFSQGMENQELAELLFNIAPVIFFGHSYHGTCISGAKAFKFPAIQPCNRQFGLACLAQYYPRRCGGLNPLTMLRQFTFESRRSSLLPRYHAVLVASSHMAVEYERHGCEGRIFVVPYPVPSPQMAAGVPTSLNLGRCRLLFLGRLEPLKGVDVLLASLPEVCRRLSRGVSLTLAGDGTERHRLQIRAVQLMAANSQIKVLFTGWIEEERRDELLRANELLVVPSVWPEPFGMVGVEAGHFGVPSAAFNVGGIGDWLKDGICGHLASGQPSTARGLADAIVACLSDVEHYMLLQRGAQEMARGYDVPKHVVRLEEIFQKVLGLESVTFRIPMTTCATGPLFKPIPLVK